MGNAPPAALSAGGGLGGETEDELQSNPAAVLVDNGGAHTASHPDPEPSSAPDDAPRPLTGPAGLLLLPEEVGGQPPIVSAAGRAIASIILAEESAAGSTSADADPKPLLRNWAPPPADDFLPPQPGSRPPPGPGPDATTSHEPPPLPDFPHIVAPSSYLRQSALNRTAMAAVPEQPPLQPTVFDKEQSQGLVSFCPPCPFADVDACVPRAHAFVWLGMEFGVVMRSY